MHQQQQHQKVRVRVEKKVVKNQQQQRVVVEKVHLKRVLKREYVKQFMILDIVQEEKI